MKGVDVVPGDIIELPEREALIKVLQGKLARIDGDDYPDPPILYQAQAIDAAAAKIPRGRPRKKL
ncbi:MAG: hypothetical protein ACHBMF_03760 [Chromatiales bacterium]